MTKNAERREKFKQIGAAISHYVIDPSAGICQANPWRKMKSGGFAVMQIDTRPGLTRKDEDKNNLDRE